MEPVETTGSFTTVNIGMVAFSVVLFALSVTMSVAGAIGYSKARPPVGRTVSVVAIVGGLTILATMVSGGAELLPETALWPALLVELGLLGTLFWVWMLVDCAVNEPNTGNNKLVWVLIVLFAHVLGAALYLLVRRPRRLAETGR